MSSLNQNGDKQSPKITGNHVIAELGGGRTLAKIDGNEVIFGGPSKSELKTDYVLEKNLEKFFRDYPLKQIGLQTHTFPARVKTPKEAGKRFNSFRTNFFADYFLAYIKVTEPHKDGRPHFHLLVAMPFDIQSGFDWDLYQKAQAEFKANGRTKEFYRLTKAYSNSATADLREYWKLLREAAQSHGLGRSEILPIRKNSDASGNYIRKYLAKGGAYRTGAWKNARLVSYSRSFKRASNCQFTWVEQGAKWRQYLGKVCGYLSIASLDALRKQFGDKWAHILYECLLLEMAPEEAATILFLRQG